MGLLNNLFGKAEEKVEFNIDSFTNKLQESGYDSEQIDDILSELQDTMESVKEKSQVSYDEFFGFSSNIENIYNFPKDRLKSCASIAEMISQNPEVRNSVKLYASYIAYGNSAVNVDDYKVVVENLQDVEDIDDNNDNSEILKFLVSWEGHTKIKRFIYLIGKDLVSFGDAFLEKLKDSNEKIIGFSYIPSKTMIMKLDNQGRVENFFQVTDPMKVKTLGSFDQAQILKLEQENKVTKFEVDEIVHFSDGSIPGENDGPLSNLIVIWRFLKILEESLVIYNVTRARRFVVYFLDVTGKTREKIKSSVRGFTSRLKSVFKLDTESGSLYSGKSTIPMSADLVIPITKDSKTDVKTIAADTSSKGFGDLSIFSNRIVDNLFVGHIFSDTTDAEKRRQIEKTFFRMVRIYQKQCSYTLQDLYQEVLSKNKGKSSKYNVEVLFPPVDNKEEIEVVDMIVRRMMVVNQLMAVLGIVPPTSWIINYVFNDLSQLEIRDLVKMLEKEQEAESEEYPDVFTEESSKRGDKMFMLSMLQNLKTDDEKGAKNETEIQLFESRHKAMIRSIEQATKYLEFQKGFNK